MIKAMQEGPPKDLVAKRERTKAQIHARVEHPFHIIKNLFRHRKVRYKGLAKNTAQLFSLFLISILQKTPSRSAVWQALCPFPDAPMNRKPVYRYLVRW